MIGKKLGKHWVEYNIFVDGILEVWMLKWCLYIVILESKFNISDNFLEIYAYLYQCLPKKSFIENAFATANYA